MKERKARLITFYLPQFHPIEENNGWWGPGFTEWTNVRKAKPLFKGHYQPHVPTELGYYDLLDSNVREAQANLAKEHGIEGFCYWHYWFGHGKRLLEKPLEKVLASGQPDFPFCLAWANETWEGKWFGAPKKVLLKQEYPGIEDYIAHFNVVLTAFKDKRYMTIDGKPIFIIYRPYDIPQQDVFLDCWRSLAVKNGLKGIYFIATVFHHTQIKDMKYDAVVVHQPVLSMNQCSYLVEKLINKIMRIDSRKFIYNLFGMPRLYSVNQFKKRTFIKGESSIEEYPCVLPNWDNTPRCSKDGTVFLDATPQFFEKQLKEAMDKISARCAEHRIIFIKSWNEWAEGNYLEPEERFGKQYLQAIKKALAYE